MHVLYSGHIVFCTWNKYSKWTSRIAGTPLGVSGTGCQKEGWRGALQATKFVVSCSRADVVTDVMIRRRRLTSQRRRTDVIIRRRRPTSQRRHTDVIIRRRPSYRRNDRTSSSDVPRTSSGVHGSTSSRRRNKTSLGPVHDVLTTSSRRRISCRDAGLSASAEILVETVSPTAIVILEIFTELNKLHFNFCCDSVRQL